MKCSKQCAVLIETNLISPKLLNFKRGIFKTIGPRVYNRLIDNLLKIVIFFRFSSNFHKVFLYFNQMNSSQKLIELLCKDKKNLFNILYHILLLLSYTFYIYLYTHVYYTRHAFVLIYIYCI